MNKKEKRKRELTDVDSSVRIAGWGRGGGGEEGGRGIEGINGNGKNKIMLKSLQEQYINKRCMFQ